jgi:hypothetical protein
MDYTEAVVQAAAALGRGEDANWELARLTWEVTHGESPVTLRQWSADVKERSGRRFSLQTASLYRQVWARFRDQDLGTRPSWTDAVVAVAPETGVGPMRERVTERYLFHDDADPAARLNIAQRLLADGHLADALLEAPETRDLVYGAIVRRQRRESAREEGIIHGDTTLRRLDGQEAAIAIDGLLARFVAEFAPLFRRLPPRGPGDPLAQRPFLLHDLDAARACLERLQRWVDTGETDLDAFVHEVLTEGRHD